MFRTRKNSFKEKVKTMIFKSIKTIEDAADYLSKEDNDFYDKCRKNFSGALLVATEKEAIKKAKEIQQTYQLYFDAGRLFVTKNKITSLEEAKELINGLPKNTILHNLNPNNNTDN